MGGFEPPSGDSIDDKRLQAGGLPHIINLFLYPRPRDRRIRVPVPPHYSLFTLNLILIDYFLLLVVVVMLMYNSMQNHLDNHM